MTAVCKIVSTSQPRVNATKNEYDEDGEATTNVQKTQNKNRCGRLPASGSHKFADECFAEIVGLAHKRAENTSGEKTPASSSLAAKKFTSKDTKSRTNYGFVWRFLVSNAIDSYPMNQSLGFIFSVATQ